VRLGKLEELFGVRGQSRVVGGVSLSGGVLVCFALQLALLLLDVRELLLPRLLVWFLLLLTRRHSCGHQEKRLQSWLEHKDSVVVRSLCEDRLRSRAVSFLRRSGCPREMRERRRTE